MTPTAEALLAELEERGIRIRAEGSTLWVSPREELDDELIERVRAAKPDLMVALTGCYACEWCGRYAFPQPTICYWCNSTPRALA